MHICQLTLQHSYDFPKQLTYTLAVFDRGSSVPELVDLFWVGGSATPCASPPPWPSIFPIILFGSTTLLTKMTGNSLHMQGPQTSQSHGSVSYRQWVRWWTLIESFLDFGFGISLGYV
jgi:hypothetical protein